MSLKKIKAGDYGYIIQLTFIDVDTDEAEDISAFTASQEMILEDPDGNQTTKTASFVTDGSDGKIEYTVQDGDVDEAGTWRVRGRVTSASAQLSTDWVWFEVGD